MNCDGFVMKNARTAVSASVLELSARFDAMVLMENKG